MQLWHLNFLHEELEKEMKVLMFPNLGEGVISLTWNNVLKMQS